MFLIFDDDDAEVIVLEEVDPVDSKEVVLLITSLDHGFFFDGVDECIFFGFLVFEFGKERGIFVVAVVVVAGVVVAGVVVVFI